MKYSKEEVLLMKLDPKLKQIIEKNKHISINSPNRNYYHSLIKLVIGQFISTSAALSITNKILLYFNAKTMKVKHFEKLTIGDIKKLGVSTSKAKSIFEITKEFSDLKINKKIDLFSEKELDKFLLSIYGIGPWTLTMFKMFSLGYRDVFSPKDAALRKGMNNANMVLINADHDDYDSYSEKWKPYRTLASMHIWKSLD